MKYNIRGKEIFSEHGIIKNGIVEIADGRIIDIRDGMDDIGDKMPSKVSSYYVLPGFIDMHVHGGGGFDTMDAKAEAIDGISHFKVREGVTSFCPTTVTAPMPKTLAAIKCVREAMTRRTAGAKIIGLFLEGPYISEEYKGAHPAEYIRPINIREIDELIAAGNGAVKSIAIAPEKENAIEAIRRLTERGINVRIGHTAACCAIMNDAIKAGAAAAVHTYNAMKPFTHREPGTVGAVLDNDDIYAEIICDFIHTHPASVSILYRQKGYKKTVLVTDCMMAGGLCDGSYMLGELDVVVKNGVATLPGGALAGSTLSMIQAVKNLHSLGIPLYEAVKSASETPAKALGIFHETGSISAGKKADMVLLDNDLNIKYVIVDGEVIEL